MKEPELLRVVLPGGQNQVVARQTQGPFHSRVERPVQHHIVHSWGLNELRELHVARAAAAWGMPTPAGARRLIRRPKAPAGRAGRSSPAPVGRVRQGLGAPPWPIPRVFPSPLAGTRPQRRLRGRSCSLRCHRPLTGKLRRRRRTRRRGSIGALAARDFWRK